MMHQQVRVFLLDDHEVVRDGLRSLIDATDDLAVAGEAGTCREARQRIPATRPDVAILDVRLPDGSGVDVLRHVRTTLPEIAVLMLTSYADQDAIAESAAAGASGFVIKQVRGRELVEQIRRAAVGRATIDASTVARYADQARRNAPAVDQRLTSLTPRQRHVLQLVAAGRTNREIASELGLAEKTIKNCVSTILLKLGVARRVEAAVFATQSGGSPT